MVPSALCILITSTETHNTGGFNTKRALSGPAILSLFKTTMKMMYILYIQYIPGFGSVKQKMQEIDQYSTSAQDVVMCGDVSE